MVTNQRVCIITNGQSYSGNCFTKIPNQFLRGNLHSVFKSVKRGFELFQSFNHVFQ